MPLRKRTKIEIDTCYNPKADEDSRNTFRKDNTLIDVERQHSSVYCQLARLISNRVCPNSSPTFCKLSVRYHVLLQTIAELHLRPRPRPAFVPGSSFKRLSPTKPIRKERANEGIYQSNMPSYQICIQEQVRYECGRREDGEFVKFDKDTLLEQPGRPKAKASAGEVEPV